MHDMRVRQNYWAIVTATIACFVFEAVWYSFFLRVWLSGIGRTFDELVEAGKQAGMHEWMQFGVALVCTAMMATAISCVTQLTGAQTAARGMKIGALLWLGFIATTLATEYVFEMRPMSLFGVNAGFWLLGFMLMGAIVGGWKKRAEVAHSAPVQASAVH